MEEDYKVIDIPEGAFNLHLFSIKADYNKINYTAFLGYYLKDGDFHFIQVPVDIKAIEDLIKG